MIENLLRNQTHSLIAEQIHEIALRTEGYSGSDMAGLCREAALGPIRSLNDIINISADDVRPIDLSDFDYAMTQVRASVSSKDLDLYLEWNQKFGSLG